MENSTDLVYLTVIAGRKQRDSLLTSIPEAGGRIVHVFYGKGSVKAGFLRDSFGFVPEENKIVITCLLQKKKTKDVFLILNEKYHFDKSNTGIAFTTPINQISV